MQLPTFCFLSWVEEKIWPITMEVMSMELWGLVVTWRWCRIFVTAIWLEHSFFWIDEYIIFAIKHFHYTISEPRLMCSCIARVETRKEKGKRQFSVFVIKWAIELKEALMVPNLCTSRYQFKNLDSKQLQAEQKKYFFNCKCIANVFFHYSCPFSSPSPR